MIMEEIEYQIEVTVKTTYIPEQSDPEQQRYVFAYTVQMANTGKVAATLLTRKWIITNARGEKHEVQGVGVVGEQPHLKPGETFEYTSGTVLETPVGSMEGSYQMIAEDDTHFESLIAPFSLSVPHSLH